jgi:chromatin remodeling complex protein RSC6
MPPTKQHKTTKPKKTKTTKKDAPAPVPTPVEVAPVPVPVPAPAPVPAPVEDAPLVETETAPVEPAVSDEFESLLQELKCLKQTIIDMTGKVAKLQKRVAKEGRKVKKPRVPGAHKNNGFSKPVDVSEELSKFLGLESGTKIARTQVTKGITKYIKEHKLQGLEDKRVINVDAALKKLLSGGEKKLSKDVPLTYFNLQTYLKRHYPKAVVTA